jgi:peptide/nickel transport system substrate-binding protein
MRNPPSGASSSRQKILSVIDSMTSPDPSTVVIKLKKPSASFLLNQSVPYVSIGRKSQLLADGNLKKNPVGTGPFKMTKYEPGSVITLEKNPSYFKQGRPYLDGISLPILKDRKTLLENLYAGKLDLYLAQPEEVAEIESRIGSKVTKRIGGSNQRNHVFMNTKKAPFSDPRVRQALSIGIDRSAAVSVMGGGDGAAIGSYMHPEGSWALSQQELAKVPGYTAKANIAEAKALLSQAGVQEGMEISLLYRTLFEATGVFMADQLAKLGFKVKPNSLEVPAITEAANSSNFDVFIWTAAPALDDPDAVMGDIGVSTAPRNWSKIVVPEADAAFEKQASELDANKRKQLVNEADRALIASFASIVLNYDAYRYFYYPRVEGKTFLLTDIYVNQRYEDVWLS